MKKSHLDFGSRRAFMKNVAKLGFSSYLLNGALAGSGLLWARGALAAETGVAPKRLITIHVTNGAHASGWHPATKGTDFVLPKGSAPFEAVRDQCIFIDHLTGKGGHGPHHQCVTNDRPDSIDIYAAKTIGKDSPYGSLHFAARAQGNLSRINNNHIPFETNPFIAYNRLFPTVSGGEGKDWETIRAQGILGMNLGMLNDLKGKLSPAQQHRLEYHAESVSALQKNILRRASGGGSGACAAPYWGGSSIDPSNLAAGHLDVGTTTDRINLFMDTIVLAMKCDLTRVATFSYGDDQAMILIPGLVSNADWHGCQHGYQNEIDNPTGRAWFSNHIVKLMLRLQEETDVDGRTMLDNTMVYITSDMGDGSAHDNLRTPVILAGGMVKGGQAVTKGGEVWDGLFDTIMAGIGIQLDAPDYPNFGYGKGVYSGFLKS